MKFFFPDSQDLISPTYDFMHDEYSPLRVRQRDDVYAHEVLKPIPYDGILVSKAIVDGSVKGSGKYSTPQRQRLYRLGVKSFFRLPAQAETLGDCGAFNYVNEERPPYTVGEVLDFYEDCGFDAGVSVDHVILGYDADVDDGDAPKEWQDRRTMSVNLALEFMDEVTSRNSPVQAVGAAQGWSPASYADSVAQLQAAGYQRIALGGMVPLRTPDILATLAAVAEIRDPGVSLHLLGVTRVSSMMEFADLGVDSFDSTSPFRQAFMDDRKNYHTADSSYVAIRVPQVDGNPQLKRKILSGDVRQKDAVRLERDCLRALRAFDQGAATVDNVLNPLAEYEELAGSGKKSYLAEYRRTLEDAPWRQCSCQICATCSIEVIIFRGTERNKRRGFHNLAVFGASVRGQDPSRRATKRKATARA
jgi:hypothetical protein